MSDRTFNYVIVKLADDASADLNAEIIAGSLVDCVEAVPAYFDGFGRHVENRDEHPAHTGRAS